MVERFLDAEEAVGSIPSAPTKEQGERIQEDAKKVVSFDFLPVEYQ